MANETHLLSLKTNNVLKTENVCNIARNPACGGRGGSIPWPSQPPAIPEVVLARGRPSDFFARAQGPSFPIGNPRTCPLVDKNQFEDKNRLASAARTAKSYRPSMDFSPISGLPRSRVRFRQIPATFLST